MCLKVASSAKSLKTKSFVTGYIGEKKLANKEQSKMVRPDHWIAVLGKLVIVKAVSI